MKEYPDFYKIIKQKLLTHYFENIYKPIMKYKNDDIIKYEIRNDYY
jgi:hypothetical protein